jgi:hypothetical protein
VYVAGAHAYTIEVLAHFFGHALGNGGYEHPLISLYSAVYFVE